MSYFLFSNAFLNVSPSEYSSSVPVDMPRPRAVSFREYLSASGVRTLARYSAVASEGKVYLTNLNKKIAPKWAIFLFYIKFFQLKICVLNIHNSAKKDRNQPKYESNYK